LYVTRYHKSQIVTELSYVGFNV